MHNREQSGSRTASLVWAAIIFLALGISLGVSWAGKRPLDLLPTMLRGVVVTVKLTIGAALLSFLVAVLAGIARASKVWLIRTVSAFYIEFFRGTSALVQMFWIFFVLPLPPFRITLTPLQAGIMALGLNVGAYGAEVVRGAILAIPRSQIEATIALNMPPGLRMRKVILPQAMIRILPPFGNLLIELLKATALVSLITLSDVTFQALSLRQTMGRTKEIFTLLLAIYFLLAYPLTLGVRWLERQRRWA
ncbi:MAG TPA: ectoine/hydroxyectoine ABC transporter permease subunit EhuC [Anaerolineae bacterium]|nr:ectoine/hydroxyectoine ABC transporter permease subunit EhuC [Anaerolineae bacterium]